VRFGSNCAVIIFVNVLPVIVSSTATQNMVDYSKVTIIYVHPQYFVIWCNINKKHK